MNGLRYQLKALRRDKMCILTFLLLFSPRFTVSFIVMSPVFSAPIHKEH